jgi:hypothetical protein
MIQTTETRVVEPMMDEELEDNVEDEDGRRDRSFVPPFGRFVFFPRSPPFLFPPFFPPNPPPYYPTNQGFGNNGFDNFGFDNSGFGNSGKKRQTCWMQHCNSFFNTERVQQRKRVKKTN